MTAPYPRERTVKVPKRRLTLPEHVIAAFKGRRYLNIVQLSAALGYSPRTIVRFCDLGILNWHQRGVGTKSRHRAVTRGDVEEFWNRTERMELDQLNERRRVSAEQNRKRKRGSS